MNCLKLLAGLSLMTLLFQLDLQAADLTEKKQIVKIGFIVPLTGGLAERGDDIAKVLPILQAHFQTQKRTYEYEFILENGACGAGNTATSAAMKLINIDKVKFLVTACSGETLQVGPLAERNRIITFAVLSLHPDIKSLGEYIFRTFIDMEKSIKGFAEHLAAECAGRVAILTEENAFTFGIRDDLSKALGSNLVYEEDFAADTADFNTLLVKANQKDARCIYLNGMSERTVVNLVNQAKRRNLTQTLFTFAMPETPSFRSATGKNSDNLFFIGTPDISDSSAEYNELFRNYLHAHPEGPSYEFILRTTFDAVKSMTDAIEAVGPDTGLVRDYLARYSADGALGRVEYDSNGDIKDLHYVLKRVREDGKHETVKRLVRNDS